MKLTLSVGGGFTGATKEHSIEVNSLDESTRNALLEYINSSGHKAPMNLNESWSLNDEKEVSIDSNKMNDKLKELYSKMKSNLSY